jgi:hypothetical protein
MLETQFPTHQRATKRNRNPEKKQEIDRHDQGSQVQTNQN